MIVVSHEAVRMDFDAESLVDQPEEAAELEPIDVVEEDRAVVDTTVHDVMPSIFGVSAMWSSHTPIMDAGCHTVLAGVRGVPGTMRTGVRGVPGTMRTSEGAEDLVEGR